MKKKNFALLCSMVLIFLLVFNQSVFAYDGIYPTQTNRPTSNNMTTGAASTTMFGNANDGLKVYKSNCMTCHGAYTAPKGTGNVTSADPESAADPGMYDINPAIFARNLDAMIQHGSKPKEAAPMVMPAWGDSKALSQKQIADVEAWILSNSNVKWPKLALSGTKLTGTNFVPASTVQLYQDGQALNGTVTADKSGNIVSNVSIPTTGQSGKITANYAILNVPGVYYHNNKAKGELAMDGSAGAAYTVAEVNYTSSATAAQPSSSSASQSGGVNASVITMIVLGIVILGVLGTAMVSSKRKNSR